MQWISQGAARTYGCSLRELLLCNTNFQGGKKVIRNQQLFSLALHCIRMTYVVNAVDITFVDTDKIGNRRLIIVMELKGKYKQTLWYLAESRLLGSDMSKLSGAIIFLAAALCFGTSCATERPIIGMLSQELSKYLSRFYDPKVYTSYISASYVKYYESSGARVVPIPIGRSLDYYRELVNRLNGVVFPGGGTAIFESTGYGPSGTLLLRALEEAAADGRPIPALGVCLGMELMAMYDYKKKKQNSWDNGPLVECSARTLNAPLILEPNAINSSLFSWASRADLNLLREQAITVNEHKWCVTYPSLNKTGLSEKWEVLATSLTRSEMEFISVMESRNRSFYAIIFHPEKNAFEWKPTKTYPHHPDAIAAMRIFGDSFVDMCRKNNNSFPLDIERKKLIYRYQTVDSGAKGIAYEQIYLFRDDDFD